MLLKNCFIILSTLVGLSPILSQGRPKIKAEGEWSGFLRNDFGQQYFRVIISQSNNPKQEGYDALIFDSNLVDNSFCLSTAKTKLYKGKNKDALLLEGVKMLKVMNSKASQHSLSLLMIRFDDSLTATAKVVTAGNYLKILDSSSENRFTLSKKIVYPLNTSLNSTSKITTKSRSSDEAYLSNNKVTDDIRDSIFLYELMISDTEKQDGDAISLYVNDLPIVLNREILKSEKSISLFLKEKNNVLKIFATDEGRFPPTTLTLSFYKQKILQETIFVNLKLGDSLERIIVNPNIF